MAGPFSTSPFRTVLAPFSAHGSPISRRSLSRLYASRGPSQVLTILSVPLPRVSGIAPMALRHIKCACLLRQNLLFAGKLQEIDNSRAALPGSKKPGACPKKISGNMHKNLMKKQGQGMIQPTYLAVLRQLFAELKESQVNWVVTGSLSFALQGLPLEPHDIDIQTDTEGAYEIERRFFSQVSRNVTFASTERMRSHFGALLIDGIIVEIMGDVQKRLKDGTWEAPVDLRSHRQVVHIEGMDIPMPSLAYEAQAYLKLGRLERAEMLREAASRTTQDAQPQ